MSTSLQENTSPGSPSSPPPEKSREQRIKEMVLTIGGYEESIRLAMEYQDWDLAKELKPLKVKAYERLRRYIYGYPEARG